MGAPKIDPWDEDDEPEGAPETKRAVLALVHDARRWQRAASEPAPDSAHDEPRRSHSGIVPVRRAARVLPFPAPATLPRFVVGVRTPPLEPAVWRPSMPPRAVFAFSAMFLVVTIIVAVIHYA